MTPDVPLSPWQPPHPLDGPRLKFIRAGNYLSEFKTKFGQVVDLNAYELIRDEYPDRNLVEWALHTPTGFGDQFQLLAGEIIYHLHSGLSHLAWQLVKLGRKPNRLTGFPMLGRCDPRRFEQMTEGMPVDAIKLINGLQPYQRGDAYETDALWHLNELRNRDAHQFLIKTDISISLRIPDGVGFTMTNRSSVDHGDIVAWCALDKYHEHELQPSATYLVTHGIGGLPGEDVAESLDRIYRYVRHLIFPLFERFFPERPGLGNFRV